MTSVRYSPYSTDLLSASVPVAAGRTGPWRQQLPPYVIFHDATLIEVARRRPVSLDTLAEIPGIGRSKLERYGTAVLAVVNTASVRC